MTAQELATTLEVYALYRDDNEGTALRAAAMLRQQAEQIEALKADAERFVRMAEYLISDSTEYDDSIISAGTLNEMREAIDAMKDKT